MDNILQNLLNAEQKAQEVVAQSKSRSAHQMDKAKADIKLAEERLQSRIKDIHLSYADKAENKAKNHLDEVELLSQERHQQLELLANKLHQQAVDDVIELITNIEG